MKIKGFAVILYRFGKNMQETFWGLNKKQFVWYNKLYE